MRGGHNRIDLTGKRSGKLVALRCIGKDARGKNLIWLCQCDCGNTKEASVSYFVNGTTSSCGCMSTLKRSQGKQTHSMSKTRIYRIWAGMIKRCEDPKCEKYDNYGGRGITVIKLNGEVKSIAAWSNDFGISRRTLSRRVKSGLTLSEAVSKIKYSRI